MSVLFFPQFELETDTWHLSSDLIVLYPGYSVKRIELGHDPCLHASKDTKELGIISKEYKYLFKITEKALVLYTYENLSEF